jgi:hypothetical protein
MLFWACTALWASLCVSFALAAVIIGMPYGEIVSLITTWTLPLALPLLMIRALRDDFRLPTPRRGSRTPSSTTRHLRLTSGSQPKSKSTRFFRLGRVHTTPG